MTTKRKSLRQQIREAEDALELASLKRLQESLDLSDRWVGNKDIDDELWIALGEGPDGVKSVGFQTESNLASARKICRQLAEENEYAINTIGNRISFVVGTGLQAKIVARSDVETEIPKETLAKAQAGLTDWAEESGWLAIHEERQRRLDRDGEVFLRIFEVGESGIQLRVVEPGQVSQPSDRTEPHYSFGIQTDPDDVESVVAYWIDGQPVPAAEIIHVKANVDTNVKRGIPTLWPLRHAFKAAAKLRRNMTSVTSAQATIAWIRRHKNMPASSIQAFAANATAAKVINPVTGVQTRYKQAAGPAILDVSEATTYEFPAAGMNAGNMVAVLQAELRAIAAALIMPEYMLSSDASNSNMASTIVAGTPADKNFKRLQKTWIVADEEFLNDRVLPILLSKGIIDATLADQIKISVEAPEVASRDRAADVRANQIEHQEGVLSRKTWAMKSGYDWEVEEANLAIEQEQAMEHAAALMLPGDPGNDPNADPNQDPNADPTTKKKPFGGGKKPTAGE